MALTNIKNLGSLGSYPLTKQIVCFLLLLFILILPTQIWTQGPSNSQNDKEEQTKEFEALSAASNSKDDKDEKEEKLGLEINLNFVTNYIFRGNNLFASYSSQQGSSPGVVDAPFAFQSDITFYTPIDGLYFNIWASVALSGRDDSSQISDTGDNQTSDAGDNQTSDTDDSQTSDADDSQEYGAGLAKDDEIDYSIIYEIRHDLGFFAFGILAYTYINIGKAPSALEIYCSYSLPGRELLPGIWGDLLTAFYVSIYGTVYSNIGKILNSGEYFHFGFAYEHEYEIMGHPISAFLNISANYGVYDGFSNLQDISASIGTRAYGATFSIHYVHRWSKYVEYLAKPKRGGTYDEANHVYFTIGYKIEL